MIEEMSAEREELLKRMKQARKEMEEESFGRSLKDQSTGEGLKERKYKKRRYKTNDVD